MVLAQRITSNSSGPTRLMKNAVSLLLHAICAGFDTVTAHLFKKSQPTLGNTPLQHGLSFVDKSPNFCGMRKRIFLVNGDTYRCYDVEEFSSQLCLSNGKTSTTDFSEVVVTVAWRALSKPVGNDSRPRGSARPLRLSKLVLHSRPTFHWVPSCRRHYRPEFGLVAVLPSLPHSSCPKPVHPRGTWLGCRSTNSTY